MEPFDPPGEPWVRVSPRLATVRRIGLLLFWVPVGAGVTVLLAVAQPWAAVPFAAGALAVLAWSWVVVGRLVRSWGYAERADDLLVTSGVLRRRRAKGRKRLSVTIAKK